MLTKLRIREFGIENPEDIVLDDVERQIDDNTQCFIALRIVPTVANQIILHIGLLLPDQIKDDIKNAE